MADPANDQRQQQQLPSADFQSKLNISVRNTFLHCAVEASSEVPAPTCLVRASTAPVVARRREETPPLQPRVRASSGPDQANRGQGPVPEWRLSQRAAAASLDLAIGQLDDIDGDDTSQWMCPVVTPSVTSEHRFDFSAWEDNHADHFPQTPDILDRRNNNNAPGREARGVAESTPSLPESDAAVGVAGSTPGVAGSTPPRGCNASVGHPCSIQLMSLLEQPDPSRTQWGTPSSVGHQSPVAALLGATPSGLSDVQTTASTPHTPLVSQLFGCEERQKQFQILQRCQSPQQLHFAPQQQQTAPVQAQAQAQVQQQQQQHQLQMQMQHQQQPQQQQHQSQQQPVLLFIPPGGLQQQQQPQQQQLSPSQQQAQQLHLQQMQQMQMQQALRQESQSPAHRAQQESSPASSGSRQQQQQLFRESSPQKQRQRQHSQLQHQRQPSGEQPVQSTPSQEVEWTTVMLGNLPRALSRDNLLAMLDQRGFGGRYDFVYLPIDFRTHSCSGYAFINLVSPEDVLPFRQRFDKFSGWPVPQTKVCTVGWSRHQGLDDHIQRYRNSPLMHTSVPDQYRPVLFQNGVRATFPDATRKIKPPRQGSQRMLV